MAVFNKEIRFTFCKRQKGDFHISWLMERAAPEDTVGAKKGNSLEREATLLQRLSAEGAQVFPEAKRGRRLGFTDWKPALSLAFH